MHSLLSHGEVTEAHSSSLSQHHYLSCRSYVWDVGTPWIWGALDSNLLGSQSRSGPQPLRSRRSADRNASPLKALGGSAKVMVVHSYSWVGRGRRFRATRKVARPSARPQVETGSSEYHDPAPQRLPDLVARPGPTSW